MESLTKVLEALTTRVSGLAVQDIRNANVSQIYGIFLLCFVMVLSHVHLQRPTSQCDVVPGPHAGPTPHLVGSYGNRAKLVAFEPGLWIPKGVA